MCRTENIKRQRLSKKVLISEIKLSDEDLLTRESGNSNFESVLISGVLPSDVTAFYRQQWGSEGHLVVSTGNNEPKINLAPLSNIQPCTKTISISLMIQHTLTRSFSSLLLRSEISSSTLLTRSFKTKCAKSIMLCSEISSSTLLTKSFRIISIIAAKGL